MKKWKLPLLLGLLMTLLGMAVNYLSFRSGSLMPLCLTVRGGETFIDMGFGLRTVYIYSMLPDGGSTKSIVFDPITFIFCLLLCTLAAAVVLKLIALIRRRKRHV